MTNLLLKGRGDHEILGGWLCVCASDTAEPEEAVEPRLGAGDLAHISTKACPKQCMSAPKHS